MKKLICGDDVARAHEAGETLCVDANTIITPAAQDMIDELHLPLKESCEAENMEIRLPDGLNKETLLSVLKMILASETNPFQYEQHANGLKVIKGSSVEMVPFETGNPEAKVTYQELVSKEEAKISAGFLEIDHSQFDWELSYEEIDYVISGSLEITIEGKKYTANPGDVVFVPKGSKVTWASPDKVKLFYATYPANWPDLL
ncbi:cupin domain-containing protein [Enterococcus hulanensis]|uniref:Cupin domain-containing protein n=1 Tax=Enterococcus hulanensis TaxID=2559929 RepID=A0ABU3EXJ0_9ENTE|nr:cupin domain-containing protein [Enterococcus hulanensis]MDT2599589.1 cupin domain-containing protein [Enterococcus hulanensis]MDT2609555.1 cupin domain-containing protein [Enterococcus hulanensis]MDT2616132.1 cupin domain-containing protein [Enterococcus hulanensis]MDT2627828.1 cupin domain-containing protein [Enterococcus hulanensis]MDT2654933.1 cupin domain-containing protein [Enterococcus hulanensis]